MYLNGTHANGTFLALNGASVGGTDGSLGFWVFSSFPGRFLLSHCQRCVLADSSGLNGLLNERPKNKTKQKNTGTLAPQLVYLHFDSIQQANVSVSPLCAEIM